MPARADGDLVVGPAQVAFHNGQTEDCIETVLCAASLSGDSAADVELDLSQHLLLGLIVDDSALEHATDLELLPDGGLVIDASTLVIRHRVFRTYVELVGTRHGPGPLSAFGVVMDNETYGFDYLGPSLAHPSEAVGPQRFDQNFSEEGVGYDSFTPGGSFGNSTTDKTVEDALALPCWKINDTSCEATQSELAAGIAEVTPDLRFGVGFYAVGVGVDPASVAGAIEERHGAPGAGPGRKPVTTPDSRPVHQDAGRGLTLSPPIPRGDLIRGETPSQTTEPSTRAPGPAREESPSGEPNPLAPLAAAFALAVALAALFSRFRRREDALHNARRLQFLAVLEERGPLTYAQVADALGVDRSTVVHHAAILVRTKNVFTQRCGKYLYVALPGQQVAQARTPQDVADAILATLRERGGTLPRAELHATIGSLYPLRSRNQGLRRLAQRGAIERSFQGATEVIRLVAPQSL